MWTEEVFTIVGDNLNGRIVYVSYQGYDPPTEIEIVGMIYDLVGDEAIQRNVS